MHEFTYACESVKQSACAAEGFYKEIEGRQYCVLHYPSTDKIEDFNEAISRKLSAGDFNFRGVWFPAPIFFSSPFSAFGF